MSYMEFAGAGLGIADGAATLVLLGFGLDGEGVARAVRGFLWGFPQPARTMLRLTAAMQTDRYMRLSHPSFRRMPRLKGMIEGCFWGREQPRARQRARGWFANV